MLTLPRCVLQCMINTPDYLGIVSHCRFSSCPIWWLNMHDWVSLHFFRIEEPLWLLILRALSMDVLQLVIVLLGWVLNTDIVHSALALLRPWLRSRCRKPLPDEGRHFLLLEFKGAFRRGWALVTSPCMFLGKHPKLFLSWENSLRSYFSLQMLLLLLKKLCLLLLLRSRWLAMRLILFDPVSRHVACRWLMLADRQSRALLLLDVFCPLTLRQLFINHLPQIRCLRFVIKWVKITLNDFRFDWRPIFSWQCHLSWIYIKFNRFWTAETSLIEVNIVLFSRYRVKANNLIMVLAIPISISCPICIWSFVIRWVLSDSNSTSPKLFQFFFDVQRVTMSMCLDAFVVLFFLLPQIGRYPWCLFWMACCFRLRRQIVLAFTLKRWLLEWLVK